jgi:hypothetical protein
MVEKVQLFGGDSKNRLAERVFCQSTTLARPLARGWKYSAAIAVRVLASACVARDRGLLFELSNKFFRAEAN